MNKKNMNKKPKAKLKLDPKVKVEAKCFINEVCDQNSISVYALSKSIGMHPNQMYTYTSDRALPNLITALTIAKTLNTSVDKLWTVTINK